MLTFDCWIQKMKRKRKTEQLATLEVGSWKLEVEDKEGGEC